MNELKKHVFANTVDRVVLKKLVRKLFPRCRCREIHERVKEFSQVKNCSKFKLFSFIVGVNGFCDKQVLSF